jgi:hypothetical protein
VSTFDIAVVALTALSGLLTLVAGITLRVTRGQRRPGASLMQRDQTGSREQG